LEKPVVLFTKPALARAAEAFSANYRVETLWDKDEAEFLAGPGKDVEAIVHLGEFVLPTTFVEALPKLRLICVPGTGYDGVDVPHARARGIEVTHGAWMNAAEVADHAIGLAIAAWRGILAGHNHIVSGGWERGERLRPFGSLTGKKIGVVGLGHIGAGVARRAEAMEMQVSWWGPRDKPGVKWPKAESVLALAEWADVLVVAAQATDENRHMIDAAVMAALGKRGLLVNVARGQVIDEDALIAALKAGTLGMAALDVFWEEPTPAARWEGVPNVVLTPHLGGSSADIVVGLIARVAENLRLFFAGEPVANPVPPQA